MPRYFPPAAASPTFFERVTASFWRACLSLKYSLRLIVNHVWYPARIPQVIAGCVMAGLLCGFAPVNYLPSAHAEQLSEYRLKTAFLYNFATFTQWPENNQSEFNVCIYGQNPFNGHLDNLQEKKISDRPINVSFRQFPDSLDDCQLVFVSRSEIPNLKRILEALDDKPILTIADTPNACQKGVALNMGIEEGKVIFEANLVAAEAVGLSFSSQLLRFAKKIYSQ